jgi:hypothetical protein
LTKPGEWRCLVCVVKNARDVEQCLCGTFKTALGKDNSDLQTPHPKKAHITEVQVAKSAAMLAKSAELNALTDRRTIGSSITAKLPQTKIMTPVAKKKHAKYDDILRTWEQKQLYSITIRVRLLPESSFLQLDFTPHNFFFICILRMTLAKLFSLLLSPTVSNYRLYSKGWHLDMTSP